MLLTPYERFAAEVNAPGTFIAGNVHRKMYDAMGSNATTLVPFNPSLVAAYRTGSLGIPWSDAERALFPNATFNDIDQAGVGSPVYECTTMDVEPGAFGVNDVSGWTSRSTAQRPTVYCDRNDYPSVRGVWKAALWLAWPRATQAMVQAFAQQVLGHPDPNIVACQNVFTQDYDVSDVYDPTWPLAQETKGAEMLNGVLDPTIPRAIPFPAGMFKEITLYHDFTQSPYPVRVAVHSASKGYTQIINFEINISDPMTIAFKETDADGISLVNNSTREIGFTLT